MDLDSYMISSAFYSEGPVRNDFHHHNEYELIFVTEGSVEVTINTTSFIAKKNDIIFIANLEHHSLKPCDKVYHRYCAMLRSATADDYIRNTELLNILRYHPQAFPHCLNLSTERDKVIGLFERLLANDSQRILANEMAACLVSELLITTVQIYPVLLKQNLNEITKNCVLAVQAYITQHYAEQFSIPDICKMFYISPTYLSHQFKMLTGYGPKRYIILLRLKHAAIMIHDTEKSISEIAYVCGFPDINNFCKMFKHEYGCTPTSFRRGGNHRGQAEGDEAEEAYEIGEIEEGCGEEETEA